MTASLSPKLMFLAGALSLAPSTQALRSKAVRTILSRPKAGAEAKAQLVSTACSSLTTQNRCEKQPVALNLFLSLWSNTRQEQLGG